MIQTEKNLSRICADGAIFSVFGEYESQLMEAYHIFGLDGSYGTGEFNEDKIIGRMHYYSNKNIDYKINGIQYLTDNKGQAFREQVLTYMEQKYGIGLIEDLAGRTSVWEEESIQGEEIRQVEETIFGRVRRKSLSMFGADRKNRNFICCNAEGYAAFRASDRS